MTLLEIPVRSLILERQRLTEAAVTCPDSAPYCEGGIAVLTWLLARGESPADYAAGVSNAPA